MRNVWFAIVALSTFSAGELSAEDWANWRGPHGDGTAVGSGFPANWSESENIAWKIDLPSKAGSTPIILGDAIFLTATVEGMNALVRYDRSGQQQWVAKLGAEVPGKHKKGSGCNPSPVCDGQAVYTYFKNGDFGAVDLTGKVLWQRNLQKDYGVDTLWWDLGTSPVLTSQHVVVACVQSGPSYLAAFNKQTGETVWKVERNTGAPEEAAQTYATPVVTTFEGQEQIVVLGADQVTCHSAADGQQLWYLGGMNPDQDKYFRSISSPVVTNGVVIAPYARGKTLTAIKLGGSGDISKSHVLWQIEGLSSDVPSPAAQDGKVFVCTDRGTAACLDVQTGKEIWKQDLDKNRNNYSASPIVADGKVFYVREDAATFVLNADSGSPVHESNTLPEEYTVSTPVLVDGSIYLRTFDHLYCIRNTAQTRR